jgi:hypothetical protein
LLIKNKAAEENHDVLKQAKLALLKRKPIEPRRSCHFAEMIKNLCEFRRN